MTFRAVCSLLAFGAAPVHAQDTLAYHRFDIRRELGVMIGYSKEIGSEDKAPIHFAELGMIKGVHGGRHMQTTSIHASTLFGMSGTRPILAPRIGAQVSMAISFGVELACFTDLHEGSLVLIPSIGYFGYPLNIALKPNVYLINTGFKPAGGGCLSVTYRLITLKRYGKAPVGN